LPPAGWRYDGPLCQGAGDTGLIWECPLLCQLSPFKPPPATLPLHTLGLERPSGPLSPNAALRALSLLDGCAKPARGADGACSRCDTPEADER
jgi:hypothetical protein